MVGRLRAWLPWSAGLLLTLAGCRGVSPTPATTARLSPPRRVVRPLPQATAHIEPKTKTVDPDLVPVSYEQKPEPVEPPKPEPPPEKPPEKSPLGDRLQIPANLPGRDAPNIVLPEPKPGNEAARKEAVERYFPALPALTDLPKPQLGTDGKPVSLADLQRTALNYNPQVRQANAAIEAARGAAHQASLYPNPSVGYAGDTYNMGSTIGTLGGYIGQKIKTGGKLHLAYAAAMVEVENAELNRRKIEIDLITQVRKGYFNVLVAERSLLVARAFAGLTTEVYAIQVNRLRQGQAAIDEPLQARVLAMQARAGLLRSRNRYVSAWKQLTASMGRPELPPLALAGDLDRAVPRFTADQVLEQVLRNNTEVRTADNSFGKAQLQLQLALVTPKPDIDLGYKLQYDQTTLPNNAVHSINIGIELPLWNRNQGGIHEADARLAIAGDERDRVRYELTARIAAAFEKYDNARSLVLMYRDQIVPDQARAYRNMYRRYDTVPESLNFNDVITSQQTLAETIRNYVETIGNLWDAVTDITNLLQTDELFEDDPRPESSDHCPVPHLETLPLPGAPVKPMPEPEAAAPKTGVEEAAVAQEEEQVVEPNVESTETPQDKVEFKVREVDEHPKKVSFEVRQVLESQRLPFKVVPVEEP